jgi:hypothetical protein
MSDRVEPLPLLVRQPARIRIPGQDVRLEGVNVFRCPVCRNEFRYDDEYEPICTGPHPSLDEHEPAVMVRVDDDDRRVQIVVGGR